jgi:hypothetical protein
LRICKRGAPSFMKGIGLACGARVFGAAPRRISGKLECWRG